MKGGKKGRKRRGSAGDAKRKPGARGAATSDSVTRPWVDAPKKGNKGKSFGGRSSQPEE